PAADQERRPRVRHLERHRREGALRFVALSLVGADPVLPLVLALHVTAAREDGVALDRLVLERLALCGPVFEGAGLEIEIEPLAVRPAGKNAFPGLFRRLGRVLGEGEQTGQQDDAERETDAGHGGSLIRREIPTLPMMGRSCGKDKDVPGNVVTCWRGGGQLKAPCQPSSVAPRRRPRVAARRHVPPRATSPVLPCRACCRSPGSSASAATSAARLFGSWRRRLPVVCCVASGCRVASRAPVFAGGSFP